MSTTTYENNHSSSSFPRRNIRTTSTINAMTNDRSRFPLQTNHFPNPIPPIRESLTTNKLSLSSENSVTPRTHLNTNENLLLKSSKQIYTFSNPPREIQPNRKSSYHKHLRPRIYSAPDEQSPRSRLNQPKSSSANGSLTPRSHDDNNSILKRDKQQKDSLNALLKVQEKSKVPKAVQRRRIVLLFPRLPSRQEQNSSPISEHNQIPTPENPINSSNNQYQIQLSQPSDNIEPEMVDSMQLAAILAKIQLQDEGSSPEVSSRQQQQTTLLDPSRYEYVATSPLDTATFRLSPRTLKPNEELAARLRFSPYYRHEMRSSSNAQLPPLLTSIVTENNTTIGNGQDLEQTFTIKFNSTDSNKKQNLFDDDPSSESTMDNELVQLYYDATLKGFYDPSKGEYYDFKPA